MPIGSFTFGGGGVQYGTGLSGRKDLRANIRKLIKEMPREVARAVAEEWHVEKRESMKKTPWKTKRLMRSHRVLTPQIIRGSIYSGLTVGDEATEKYAIPVHEDLEMNHPHGEAKFLESTVRESAPYMLPRIAERIDLRRIIDSNETTIIPEDFGGEEV